MSTVRRIANVVRGVVREVLEYAGTVILISAALILANVSYGTRYPLASLFGSWVLAGIAISRCETRARAEGERAATKRILASCAVYPVDKVTVTPEASVSRRLSEESIQLREAQHWAKSSS